jgi:hypothetical protein
MPFARGAPDDLQLRLITDQDIRTGHARAAIGYFITFPLETRADPVPSDVWGSGRGSRLTPQGLDRTEGGNAVAR